MYGYSLILGEIVHVMTMGTYLIYDTSIGTMYGMAFFFYIFHKIMNEIDGYVWYYSKNTEVVLLSHFPLCLWFLCFMVLHF